MSCLQKRSWENFVVLRKERIDESVEKCTEWDEIKEDHFQLDSGENITAKYQYKYYDNGTKKKPYLEARQFFVDGKLIHKGSTSVDTFDSVEGSAVFEGDDAKKMMKKVEDFMAERKRIEAALPYWNMLLSTDYKLEVLATDKTFQLNVQNEVTFGDCKDVIHGDALMQQDAVNEKSLTRPFHPGK